MLNEFDLEMGMQPIPVNACYCWVRQFYAYQDHVTGDHSTL